jgi:hypothetical protein
MRILARTSKLENHVQRPAPDLRPQRAAKVKESSRQPDHGSIFTPPLFPNIKSVALATALSPSLLATNSSFGT